MFMLSRRVHATLDYVTSSVIAALPLALDVKDDDPTAQSLRRYASITGALSALTNYERGVVKLVPYRVHLAVDALAIVLLVVGSMSANGENRRRPWLPFVLAGALGVVLLLSVPGAIHEEPEEKEAPATGARG